MARRPPGGPGLRLHRRNLPRSAARAYPLEGIKKTEIETALGYFENNDPRMRYHWFRQCGLFAGSGVVEASCKSVGQRLKQAGMQWTVNGADAIIRIAAWMLTLLLSRGDDEAAGDVAQAHLLAAQVGD